MPAFPTRGSVHLFSYLVLNGERWLDRDVLSGTLWPDRTDDAARKALRSELWRIRQTLRDGSADPDAWFVIEPRRIRFVAPADAVAVDVRAFEEVSPPSAPPNGNGAILQDPIVAALESALALYVGDLLPGVYEPWAFLERERLHLRRLEMLQALVSHYQAVGSWQRSLAHAHLILRVDALREPAHRAVMEAYRALGDRPSAIRQYQRLRWVLNEELDVEPMPETEVLYREIRGLAPV